MNMEDRDIHPLLTAAEISLLDLAAGTLDEDLSKLRDIVWRLAKLKMHEGVFPKYVAVIDNVTQKAFATLLVEKLPVGRSRLIWNGEKTPTEHCALLSTTIECPPTDLLLLARPCLRIAESVPRSIRERLADLGRLCVTVQNLPLRSLENDKIFHTPLERSEGAHHIWQGRLTNFLADEKGYGMERQQTTLDVDPRKSIVGLFGTGRLDEYQQVYPHDFGIFLTNGTVVSIDIQYPILCDETVVIDTGLVMARYTSGRAAEEGSPGHAQNP